MGCFELCDCDLLEPFSKLQLFALVQHAFCLMRFFSAMLIECVFAFRSYEPVPCSLLGEAALLFSQWLQLEFSKEFKSNRGIRSETRQEFQFYPILIYAIPIYCKCIVAPAIQAAGQVGSK